MTQNQPAVSVDACTCSCVDAHTLMQEIHSNEARLDTTAELQHTQIYHPILIILNKVKDILRNIS